MPKAKQASTAFQLDPLARQILGDLLAEFLAQKRGADALHDGYIGVSLSALVQRYCDSGRALQVDFDLALKQLEDCKFIGTGPMEPYKNDPNSQLFFMVMFSKREYAYLTEDGYRAARQSQSGFERF